MYIYGAVSFVYNPDTSTGEAPRNESYPSLAPGQSFPGNFHKNSRPPARNKFARPPAGKKTRRPSAGADWPGKNLLDNRFCLRKKQFEKMQFL